MFKPGDKVKSKINCWIEYRRTSKMTKSKGYCYVCCRPCGKCSHTGGKK